MRTLSGAKIDEKERELSNCQVFLDSSLRRKGCARLIRTSYFAYFAKKVKSGEVKPWEGVSIARKTPKGFPGKKCSVLAPGWELLSDYKTGKIDDAKYTERYKAEILAKIPPENVAHALDGKILLCWEKPDKFCHRHIVAEWLREAGFDVDEVSGEGEGG